jgi:tRNA G18 (ribose-2'-O)-methylase SpoU
MTGEYAICECSSQTCRLRYPAGRRDRAYARCPACHAPVTHVHFLAPQAERAGVGGADGGVMTLPLAALLDNVRSVHNTGSIFRSADGAGFRTLYLCGVTPTPANPKLGKTALGAHSAVHWQWAPNAVDLAQTLRAAGHRLWALEESPGAESLYAIAAPPAHTILVVGSEVTGIDPGLLALCDRTLAIPMRGVKRSLNVATAFGIAALVLAERMAGALEGTSAGTSAAGELG